MVREEQKKARREEELEREESRIAKEFHSQIKEVCEEFARIKGWKCECQSVGHFVVFNYKLGVPLDSSSRIWAGTGRVWTSDPFPHIMIKIACCKDSDEYARTISSILPKKFTKSSLADAIVKAYEDMHL